MDNKIFQLKQVYYSYLGKIPALCGVDLEIEKGSKVAVIGANGTGKSTVLMMLDSLIYPDRGSIKAFGKELKEEVMNDEGFSAVFRRKVGFVFQNPDVQLFCPTVGEDIAFGPLQFGMEHEEIRDRTDKLSKELGISGLLDRTPQQLSIGEKRKVTIASVLIMDPDVLLLDEPTAGLDPRTTRHIIDMLLKKNEEGKTIITSTHDMHIVNEIAGTVHVFSSEKKIIRSAKPDDILQDREFLNSHNLIHIHRHAHEGVEHTHPH